MKNDETTVSNDEKSSAVESLNILRFLHQSIMLASAAIFILGLTPDPSSDYNAALNELITLKSIEPLVQEYPSYLQQRLHPPRSDPSRFILDVAMQTGTRMPEHIATPQPFVCDCGVSGVHVSDYYAFLSEVHKLAPLELTYDGQVNPTVDFLKRQMAIQRRVPRNLQFEGVEPSFDGMGQLRDGTSFLDWRNLPPDHKLAGYVQFVFKDTTSLTNPRFAVPVAVTYSLGAVQEGHFAVDWLRSSPMGAQLVDPKSDDVFPKLRKLGFWRSISMEKDVDTAISSLQKKLDSINTEITSFFGISVNKAIALWAGPFVCFGIEWFFLRHLSHFLALGFPSETVKNYPWVALFQGLWSGLTTYVSLLALPPMANLLLLCRCGNPRDWSTTAGICFTILTVAVGLRTFRQLRRFRNAILSPWGELKTRRRTQACRDVADNAARI